MRKSTLFVHEVRGGYHVEECAGDFEAVCVTLDELLTMVAGFYAPPAVVPQSAEVTTDEESDA